jgi:superfamily II DNA or RNA helicase
MNHMVITPPIAAIYPEIVDRRWSQEGLQTWSRFIGGNGQVFFTHACPGSGKTRYAIAAIKHAEDMGDIDMVVVVAPTDAVRSQWETETRRHAVHLYQWTSERLRDSIMDNDVPHLILTYHQLTSDNALDALEAWSRRRQMMGVLDEIHHCGDDREWGRGVETAFRNAKRIFVLSGTPFRSDQRGIPFITEGTEKLPPHVAYEYKDAIIDGVCRIVVSGGAILPTCDI